MFYHYVICKHEGISAIYGWKEHLLYKLENYIQLNYLLILKKNILYIVGSKFQTQTCRRHAKVLMADTNPKEYLVDIWVALKQR